MNELAEHGLDARLAQCSVSLNTSRGTLRGMHYQTEPYAETKLVCCTAGALVDVIIDLRPASPTYKQWIAAELSAANRRMVYIPKGFAHGFQTLDDRTEVLYFISEPYAPSAARGVRWNDPTFDIKWPPAERVISERDQQFPDFQT